MPRTTNTKKLTHPRADKIKQFCKGLYLLGWHTLTQDYDGYGDSCESFEQYIENEKEKISLQNLKLPAGTPFNAQDIRTALEDILPAGFENEEGAYGTVVVTIETGDIVIEHNERYVETHLKTFIY
jgi:hypothetical protein